ncbi:MAG: glycosyltransferase family 2 protein [Candidatus Coatesbacteria bacterium]|nr:glycosyltransferase family 2 protein [Candidatus Coatesbacteria bacterium]
MTEPRVAIVIVTWNKKDYLINLLESLREIDYQNFSIILVDNASTDGTAEYVKEHFPDITLLLQKENIGGTGGFNAGMTYVVKQGKHDYVWLLDNDVKVEKDALRNLVLALENRLDSAVAGSVIRNMDFPDFTVSAGGNLDEKNMIPVNRERNSVYISSNGIIEVEYAPSCSFLTRVKIIKEIGIFDENFFLNLDDIEWTMRVSWAGYKVLIVRNSVIYHPSFWEKGTNLVYIYYQRRNRLYFALKYIKKGNFRPVFRILLGLYWLKYQSEEKRDGLFASVVEKIIEDIKSSKMGRIENYNFSPSKQVKLVKWNNICEIIKNKKLLILPTVKGDDIKSWYNNLKQEVSLENVFLGVEKDRRKCLSSFAFKYIDYAESSFFKKFLISFGKIAIISQETDKSESLFNIGLLPVEEGVLVFQGSKTNWLVTFIKAFFKAFSETRYLLRNNPFK